MSFTSTSRVQRHQSALRHTCLAGFAALSLVGFGAPAHAADKPPLAPDTVAPFSTGSRLSAGIEFSLPALAADIERDIPQRLASIDEKIECVHRRILFFKVNANCDVWGYVERSGGVSLYGRGDRVYGSVRDRWRARRAGRQPLHGAHPWRDRGQRHHRSHGASPTQPGLVARPQFRRRVPMERAAGPAGDGSRIPLAKYAEPRIRSQLAVVREHALAAARRLDLRDKAATAWRHAFEPIQLSDSPAVWLQMTPQSVSFAGMRANSRTLRGSIELSGTAQTIVGQDPPAVTATALPTLGDDVSTSGAFDVILPVRVGYDVLRDKLTQVIAAMPPVAGISVKDVDVYPSSGKLSSVCASPRQSTRILCRKMGLSLRHHPGRCRRPCDQAFQPWRHDR